MKHLLRLLAVVLACALLALGAHILNNTQTTRAWAGIVGTNLLSLASYTAGTNTSVSYTPPQTHTMVPQTITIYHSDTNSLATNYLETSFDGGVTWTVVTSYVTGTNNTTEIWTPTLTSIVASNRIRVLFPSNQTYYLQANWIQ